jgi:hypothetical protein
MARRPSGRNTRRLLKDDPQVLRMFRREVVEDKGKRAKQDNTDNISIKPPASDGRGTSIKLIMTM